MQPSHPFLAVVGGGNMGKAIITGGVHAKILSPARVCVAEHDATRRARIAATGVTVLPGAGEAMAWLATKAPTPEQGQVLLAIKPQSLDATCSECAGRGMEGRVLVSILAGTTTQRLGAMFPGARIVRAMPNLPAAVEQGATALCLGSGASDADAVFAERVFRGIGPLVLRVEEPLMDAFTALAGSGPAYVFYLAEAMIEAARAMGFSASDAASITRTTLLGSATLLAQSSDSPTALREAVTSKGGTTQAALAHLGERDVRGAIVGAILAARDRGQEIASA